MDGIFNKDHYFQELEQIVNTDSPSNYPEGNIQMIDFFHHAVNGMRPPSIPENIPVTEHALKRTTPAGNQIPDRPRPAP